MPNYDRMRLGSELCHEDQDYVLRAFVNRYTGDHLPAWVRHSPDRCPVQFANDRDWLENTRFFVREDGRLDRRHQHCQSTPTWPNNPELRPRVRESYVERARERLEKAASLGLLDNLTVRVPDNAQTESGAAGTYVQAWILVPDED